MCRFHESYTLSIERDTHSLELRQAPQSSARLEYCGDPVRSVPRAIDTTRDLTYAYNQRTQGHLFGCTIQHLFSNPFRLRVSLPYNVIRVIDRLLRNTLCGAGYVYESPVNFFTNSLIFIKDGLLPRTPTELVKRKIGVFDCGEDKARSIKARIPFKLPSNENNGKLKSHPPSWNPQRKFLRKASSLKRNAYRYE